MTWTFPMDVLPHMVSGALLAVFSAWVGHAGGRTKRSRAFARFGIAFGAFGITANLDEGFRGASGLDDIAIYVTLQLVSTALAIVAGLGLLQLVRTMRPASLVHERWGLVVVGLAMVGVSALIALEPPEVADRLGFATAAFIVGVAAEGFLQAAMWIAALVGAAAFHRVEPHARRDLMVLAAAVAVYPAQLAPFYVADSVAEGSAWGIASFAAVMLLVALVTTAWLRAGHRVGGSAGATLVALLPLAAALAGTWLKLAGQPSASGYARVFAVVVLAYAILRHNMMGIDLKIRWTISKSTLAAGFIAVFFIASEAAQQFFGERFQSEYLGIAAAGILVFAISPLSRLADRLAEKAVPIRPLPAGDLAADRLDAGSADSVYRAAVRAARRDGVLTRREEMHLAEVAEGLGIGPRRALQIRGEVEEDDG